ncbi:MAG: hypothetical protein KKE20_03595, partial [Nanoarchaeota archaeon]|nr:hypothetical protein [Nanoarchaeota archaeon]
MKKIIYMLTILAVFLFSLFAMSGCEMSDDDLAGDAIQSVLKADFGLCKKALKGTKRCYEPENKIYTCKLKLSKWKWTAPVVCENGCTIDKTIKINKCNICKEGTYSCDGTLSKLCSLNELIPDQDCGTLGCNAETGQCNAPAAPLCEEGETKCFPSTDPAVLSALRTCTNGNWVTSRCELGCNADLIACKTACEDGTDNDGDGLVDSEDPGCYKMITLSTQGATEEDTLPVCSDNFDNDKDGLTDYPEDPGCSSTDDPKEEDPLCSPAPCVVMEQTESGNLVASADTGSPYDLFIWERTAKAVGGPAVGTQLSMYYPFLKPTVDASNTNVERMLSIVNPQTNPNFSNGWGLSLTQIPTSNVVYPGYTPLSFTYNGAKNPVMSSFGFDAPFPGTLCIRAMTTNISAGESVIYTAGQTRGYSIGQGIRVLRNTIGLRITPNDNIPCGDGIAPNTVPCVIVNNFWELGKEYNLCIVSKNVGENLHEITVYKDGSLVKGPITVKWNLESSGGSVGGISPRNNMWHGTLSDLRVYPYAMTA